VAISTAAAAGLDRILVDTVETADACLKYLKENDIGRVNMLALDNTKR
jgi:structural maintenance of chromosome 4